MTCLRALATVSLALFDGTDRRLSSLTRVHECRSLALAVLLDSGRLKFPPNTVCFSSIRSRAEFNSATTASRYHLRRR